MAQWYMEFIAIKTVADIPFKFFSQESGEIVNILTDANELSRSDNITSIKGGKNDTSLLPQIMIGVWYNSGTLWVHLNKARNLGITKGKVYAKAYLLPDSGSSKQKTGIVQGTDPQFNATMAVSRSLKFSIKNVYTLL